MILKGIAATTKVDAHNTIITKEALIQAANDITTGTHVPSVGIEHDLTVMPIGKLIKAHVGKLDDFDYALYTEQDIFDKYTTNIDGQPYVMLKSRIDNRPFVCDNENNQKLIVQTDLVNFETREECDWFFQSLQEEFDVEPKLFTRKSVIPDPELVFQFVEDSFKMLLLYLANKKAIDKVGDHIIDNVLCELDSLWGFIKRTILTGAKLFIPKNRPVTYVFRGNCDFLVELIVQTANPNEAIEAINEEKLKKIINEFEYVKNRFLGVAKVQLMYNIKDGEWEFNYLTTDKGEVIGTEKAYKATVKKLDIILPIGNNENLDG